MLLRTHLLRWILAAAPLTSSAQSIAHELPVAPGKTITLSLPAGLDIHVAASGLHRVRFFAKAPDGRIFVTGMYSRADNTRGTVWSLDDYDASQHTFRKVTPYLDHLHNPNSIAFATDNAGRAWLYLALTDKLLRYAYHPGDQNPTAPPETLLSFPAYGLDYKYGGWHLTRTVTVGQLHGKTRVFVSVGSSCNYCREHESVRASVMSIDLDGSHPTMLAHGMRNAVDLRYVPDLDGGALFATNMGDDHLGDRLPEDTFFELDSNRNISPLTPEAPANFG